MTNKIKVIGELNSENVSITGLDSFLVQEILEKMVYSLRRKSKRKFHKVVNSLVYELVVELRKLFPDDYGLSLTVDRILEEIKEYGYF